MWTSCQHQVGETLHLSWVIRSSRSLLRVRLRLSSFVRFLDGRETAVTGGKATENRPLLEKIYFVLPVNLLKWFALSYVCNKIQYGITAMEVNPIVNTIKDMTERTGVLRRHL